MYIKKEFLVEARQYIKNKNFKEIIEFLNVDLLLSDESIEKEELIFDDVVLKNKDFVILDKNGKGWILSKKEFETNYTTVGTMIGELAQDMEPIFQKGKKEI